MESPNEYSNELLTVAVGLFACSVNLYSPGTFTPQESRVGNLSSQGLYVYQGLVNSFKTLKTKDTVFSTVEFQASLCLPPPSPCV